MPETPEAGTGPQDLIDYVGAHDSETERASECWDQAVALIAAFVGDAEVPAAVLKGARLEVGSKLWQRRNSPNGQAQYADMDAVPALAPRDPLITVYPVLRPFVGGGFA